MKGVTPKVGDCMICGIQTRSLGYRVFVCKSCAMFYRRTYLIRDQLQCKEGTGNCQLMGNYRSNCRYCRLMKCREIGLRMVNSSLVVQHNGFPVDDVIENQFLKENVPTSSNQQNFLQSQNIIPPEPISNEPICSYINLNVFQRFPLLSKIANHLNRFETRQRKLVKSFLDQNELEHSILINNKTYLRVESASLHLMCLLISDILKEFCCNLDSKEWLKIVRETVIQLSLMHKLCLAVRQFPKLNDFRIACFLGAHTDSSDLRAHLEEEYDKRKDYIAPLWKSWMQCTKRFREIAPNAEESIFLYLTYILEEAERQNCLTNDGIRLKDSIYYEFFELLTELHGQTIAPIRLIRLSALQLDIKRLDETYGQMWVLVKVFKPDFCEYMWHQSLEEDNNFLIEYQKIAEELSRL